VGLVAFNRECLVQRLSQESDLSAVDFERGAEVLERAKRVDPDLVLVDLPPSEARALAEALLGAIPGTRPVAVHRSEAVEDLMLLAEAGYIGFVSSDSTVRDLLRELRAALREESNCSPRLTGALLRGLRKRQTQAPERADSHLAVLTCRQRQISLLLEQHYSNKEIAAKLGIEFGTVKNHVHNILNKLHVHHRWEVSRRGDDRDSEAGAAESEKRGKPG
jgi:DNA-binding NarL/FixJ family response regulator